MQIALPYAEPGSSWMNNQAEKRAQKLRQALRDNLKRRKAGPDTAPQGEAVVRREDRLEPRLGSQPGKKADRNGAGDD
jgi:hypothetical protein